jgi:flavin-dependent dehydrogenase
LTVPPAARFFNGVKPSPPNSDAYDVVVIGGALAGAASALLLLRAEPRLRVLILEKSAAFTRRVGEATVEVSAYFLGRVLGLTQYLNEEHLVKQGMRFWFSNSQATTLEQCSEIGGTYLARVAAYQVDRSTLDEEVLRRAVAAGAQLWRPAAVSAVELHEGGEQVITVKRGEQTETVRGRWVIDASGVAALLARQNGWWQPNEEHPTASVWARWRGVTDWDGLELAQRFPQWSKACHGIRATATNHLVGPGWWAWCIPLKGGDVSVGVVFDRRIVTWPETGSLGQRLKDFLMAHPVGNEIMRDATWVEGDVHWRKHLPYYSTHQAGDGHVLVGDAAAFIDPFYSPGMDWVSFSVTRATDMILAERRGEPVAPLVGRHERDFGRSAQRWFRGIYLNKYDYMGDFELMRLAFILDLGLYYLGVAAQPYKRGLDGLREPVFSTPPSVPVYWLMSTYTRRFAAMARNRKARGVWGRKNHGQRFMFPGYTFAFSSARPILRALLGWVRLELTEGWRPWFSRVPVRLPKGASTAAANYPMAANANANANAHGSAARAESKPAAVSALP